MFTPSMTRMSQLTRTAIVVTLALSLSSIVLAKPKNDNHGRRHKNNPDNLTFIDRGQSYPSDSGTTMKTDQMKKEKKDKLSSKGRGKKSNPDNLTFIDRGQTYPSDSGTTIRTDEQKKKDDNGGNKKNDGVILIDRGQSYPSDSGTTMKTDQMKKEKKDKLSNKGRGKKGNPDNLTFIDRGQTYPSDSGTTIRTDAMRSNGFLKSLDLSASNTRTATRTSSSRTSLTPLAPLTLSRAPRMGHGWMDATADGENGLSANAGWSWTLR